MLQVVEQQNSNLNNEDIDVTKSEIDNSYGYCVHYYVFIGSSCTIQLTLVQRKIYLKKYFFLEKAKRRTLS